MKLWMMAAVILGLVFAMSAGDATQAAKKAPKKSSEPACLNALACGPQPVPKMRKPAKEQFMRSAS